MCPCGVLLGAIPIFGQRSLAEKSRVMNGGRLLHDCYQRAPGRRQTDGLDKPDLAIGLNDCLDRSHAANSNLRREWPQVGTSWKRGGVGAWERGSEALALRRMPMTKNLVPRAGGSRAGLRSQEMAASKNFHCGFGGALRQTGGFGDVAQAGFYGPPA